MRFGSSKSKILSSGKIVLLLSVAGLVAGCSSDAQRFNPSPWGQQSSNQGGWGARQAWEAAQGGSPAASHQSEYTGSIPQVSSPQASLPQVSSQALPPVGGQSYAPPAVPGYSAPSYTAPSYTPPKVTAPTMSAPQASQDWRRPLTAPKVQPPQMSYGQPRAANQSMPVSDYQVAEGSSDDDNAPVGTRSRAAPMTPRPAAGNVVIVEDGQTLYGIARKRGISATALMKANKIEDANSIYVGQRLVVPGAKAVAPAKPAPVVALAPKPQALKAPAAPAPVAPSAVRRHTVNDSETLVSISRRYNVAPGEVARANHLGQHDRIVVGQSLVIPGAAVAAPQQHAWAQPAKRNDALTTGSIKPTQPVKPAKVEDDEDEEAPAPKAKPKAPEKAKTPDKSKPEAAKPVERPAEPVKAAEKPKAVPVVDSEVASSAPAPQAERRDAAEFRWPVSGQVISGFGPKSGGGQNDGINIAVPAGTPVKASENGVVLYSGSQVSGYGNLVLVRHEGNYVTAYAHASEVLVRRGDTVKRGQVIARAGQTGNVTSPQVHFEIRRDKTPVNPIKLLN